jgi:hypothetical protein
MDDITLSTFLLTAIIIIAFAMILDLVLHRIEKK